MRRRNASFPVLTPVLSPISYFLHLVDALFRITAPASCAPVFRLSFSHCLNAAVSSSFVAHFFLPPFSQSLYTVIAFSTLVAPPLGRVNFSSPCVVSGPLRPSIPQGLRLGGMQGNCLLFSFGDEDPGASAEKERKDSFF